MHYFVTRALEESADIKALAEIVGFRPETLMRHYQHVTQKIHRKTVAKIPKLDVPQKGKNDQNSKKLTIQIMVKNRKAAKTVSGLTY